MLILCQSGSKDNPQLYFLMARECAKNMIQNQYGRIINTASMYGHIAAFHHPILAYNETAVMDIPRLLLLNKFEVSLFTAVHKYRQVNLYIRPGVSP